MRDWRYVWKDGIVLGKSWKTRSKLRLLDMSNGTGTANTALAYHNGQLLSLCEADKPYAIRVLEDGDLETIGRIDYNNKLNHPFTAHPKVDPVTGVFQARFLNDRSYPRIKQRLNNVLRLVGMSPKAILSLGVARSCLGSQGVTTVVDKVGRFDKLFSMTGEMFTFGYQVDVAPHAIYRVISKDGVMEDPVPLTLSGPIMMHDMAITENYSIFMDCPLYFNPKDMVMKNQFLFSFDDTKPARFGILPKYAKNESQIQWFELSNCVIFHNANAWEEGDEIVLVSCRIPSIDLGAVGDYDPEKVKLFVNDLWEYRFNLKTRTAVERRLGEFQSDFPRINEEYVGRKNRFVYTAIFEDATHIIGIAKYDLDLEPELGKKKLEVGGNVAGVVWHGSKRYGSEPVYVPKNPGRDVEEDDGYIMCFVHDENTQKSEVQVIDAKTMSSDPVAVIELPTRVPYGFHALFVSEDQLQSQKV